MKCPPPSRIFAACNMSWSVLPFTFVCFWRLNFFMATILKLKVAKRRLFKKVSLERWPTVYFVTIRTIVQTVRTMGHFHLLSIPLPLWPTEGAIDGLGNQRGRGSLLRPFWGGNCVSTFYFLINSEGGVVSALWASFLGDKKLTFLSLYYSESLVKLQGEVGNCERLWKVSQNCVNL